MYTLVKMLHNTQKNTFHPIYYLDSPFPGGIENNSTVIRYKSKGHHTTGFDTREAAVFSANDLIDKLNGMGNIVAVELDENEDLIWEDNEMPTSIQIRPYPAN